MTGNRTRPYEGTRARCEVGMTELNGPLARGLASVVGPIVMTRHAMFGLFAGWGCGSRRLGVSCEDETNIIMAVNSDSITPRCNGTGYEFRTNIETALDFVTPYLMFTPGPRAEPERDSLAT